MFFVGGCLELGESMFFSGNGCGCCGFRSLSGIEGKGVGKGR